MLILCPPDPTAHSGFVLGRGVLENAHDFVHLYLYIYKYIDVHIHMRMHTHITYI